MQSQNPGAIALVGSGEYLPVMQEVESYLLSLAMNRGKNKTFIQIPTAAGQESPERLQFWRDRGSAQADRIGCEAIFLPILSREDAYNADFMKSIESAGLIYFSGGDPHFLASVFRDTPLWGAVIKAWHEGTSLAGCSAGAMAFGSKIVGIRRSHIGEGLGLLPDIEVIPHYDKFLGWLPDRVASAVMRVDTGTSLLGIDEDTALIKTQNWKRYGRGKVHLLRGELSFEN